MNTTLQEVIREMLIKERQSSYNCIRDYLRPSAASQPAVSALDRYELCQWGYTIISACSFDKSFGCVASSYFDRFLSSHHPQAKLAMTSRHESQLVFITSLILALKMKCGMKVELDFFCETFCGDLYEVEDLIKMEMDMLVGLNWKLNGPSPHDFIEYFVELMPEQKDEMVKYTLIENSKSLAAWTMMHYSQALRLPSSIALASLVDSIEHPTDKLVFMQQISLVTNKKPDSSFTTLSKQVVAKTAKNLSYTTAGNTVRLAGQSDHGHRKSSYRRIVSRCA